MKLQKIILVLFVLIGINRTSYSAICTALANGNWSNPANWSCGALPGCGDIIFIPAGLTITVDTQVDLDENSSPACSTATFIQVSGTLQFVTGNKISLACGSGVEVMTGGSMLPGGGGGASNWLKICEITEWQTSHGPVAGFKLFGSPIPLPVEFKEFIVKRNSNSFDLEWTVASERDNDFFDIQYSYDGAKFNELVKVTSIGDHTDNYTYVRNAELNVGVHEVVYFRLRQTDKNGIEIILDVKSMDLFAAGVSLFPNPVRPGMDFNVKITSNEEKAATIFVFNTMGLVVAQESLNLQKGSVIRTISTDNLKRGVYLVQVPSISNEEFYRLIIE